MNHSADSAPGGRYTSAARPGPDVRRQNASAILRLLVRDGGQPRSDLASTLGLSSGSVSRITRELVELGIISELEPLERAEVGRRKVPIAIADSGYLAIGVNIGYDTVSAGLVDLSGRLVGPVRVTPQESSSPVETARQVERCVAEILQQCPEDAVVIGTGLSVGGVVDPQSGLVTDVELLGWRDVDLVRLLVGRIPGPVIVDSIYRSVARAEGWFGAASKSQNYVQLFARHAIGSAIVVDRTDLRGATGNAGSMAHLPVAGPADVECSCGHGPCLTSMASIGSVVDRVRSLGHDLASFAEVLEVAAEDSRVASILGARIGALSEAIVAIIDLLDPELVVMSATAVGDREIEIIRALVRTRLSNPRELDQVIVRSRWNDPHAANVIGTATAILEAFYSDPVGHLTP